MTLTEVLMLLTLLSSVVFGVLNLTLRNNHPIKHETVFLKIFDLPGKPPMAVGATLMAKLYHKPPLPSRVGACGIFALYLHFSPSVL